MKLVKIQIILENEFIRTALNSEKEKKTERYAHLQKGVECNSLLQVFSVKIINAFSHFSDVYCIP